MAACWPRDPGCPPRLRPGRTRSKRCQKQGTGLRVRPTLSIVVLRSFRFSSLGTWKIRLRCAVERVRRAQQFDVSQYVRPLRKLWDYKKTERATASRNGVASYNRPCGQKRASRKRRRVIPFPRLQLPSPAKAAGRLLPLACPENMVSFAQKKRPGREEFLWQV